MDIRVIPPNALFPDAYDVWLEPGPDAFALHLGSGSTEYAALLSSNEALRQVSRALEARIQNLERIR